MSDILIDRVEDGGVAEIDRVSVVIGIIDKMLPTMVTRQLVSTGEVSDLLLDMRSELAAVDKTARETN